MWQKAITLYIPVYTDQKATRLAEQQGISGTELI